MTDCLKKFLMLHLKNINMKYQISKKDSKNTLKYQQKIMETYMQTLEIHLLMELSLN